MIKNIVNFILLSSFFLTTACYGESTEKVEITKDKNSQEKMVVYQIFTRLFGSDNPNPTINGTLEQNGVGKYDDITSIALDSIKTMGITHVWYTGVIEHASIYNFDPSTKDHQGVIKGLAGSPYAIKDYYDVNGYMANNPEKRMEEFEALISRTHSSGMKVIIDFVPNHVARIYHSDSAPEGREDFGATDDKSGAFSPNNNFYYIAGKKLNPKFSTYYNGRAYEETPAKVTGNNVFSAEPTIDDWYETVKLNYGVDYQDGEKSYFDPIPNTWLKMRDILLFWAAKGVDGFRCDMAEMVPHQFWGWALSEVKKVYPEIVFIAEIYNPKSYKTYIDKGGFDYLYDKVGLYDTLKSVIRGNSPSRAISVNRKNIAEVQNHMLNFLENHDEQRIAHKDFAGSSRAGIPMLAISALSDGIPMMIYFGGELGEKAQEESGFSKSDGRTTIFDFWTMELYQRWRNGGKFDGAALTASEQKLRSEYSQILNLANSEKLLIDGEFLDLTEADPSSSSSVYSFLRYDDNKAIAVFANLSDSNVVTTYNLNKNVSEKLKLGKKRGLHINKQLFGDEISGDNLLVSDKYISIKLKPYQTLIISLKDSSSF